MSLLAKLITLTALQTQDEDGSDELVMAGAAESYSNGYQYAEMTNLLSTRGSCRSTIKLKSF